MTTGVQRGFTYLELRSDVDVDRLANLAEQMDTLTGAGNMEQEAAATEG